MARSTIKNLFFLIAIIALFSISTTALHKIETTLPSPPENINPEPNTLSQSTYDHLLHEISLDEDYIIDNNENTILPSLLSAPSLDQMQLAARLSASAYCVTYNPQQLANWKCQECKASGIQMESTTVFKWDGYQIGGFVGYDVTNNVIRVVYRGSANIDNWLANLNFAKASIPGFPEAGEIHNGFRIAYQQTRSSVMTKVLDLQKLYPNNKGVQVTGHSLGGAIALLAALDLKASIFTLTKFNNGLTHISSTLLHDPLPFESNELDLLGASVQSDIKFNLYGDFISFGQPRVGTYKFAEFVKKTLGSNYFRVTHHHDPVPRVPTIAMGFVHTPLEVYFYNKDDAAFRTCTNSMVEDRTCIIGPLLNLSISDHLLYVGIVTTQNASKCG
jgi:pimeloyl-ACP methyl ester carboxylesterase